MAAAIPGFDPPTILRISGQLPKHAPEAPAVALIGSRACTTYGAQSAYDLGAGLARAGVVVVSGAARGIDQAAMQGALSADGAVIAVLGSGLRNYYPPDAGGLLRRVVESGGAVVSEFPDEVSPRRHHFPQRNRLLAAFSQVVVVIEGGERSGTTNTARWALELGREVAAVPGIARSPTSAGPHRLLREGAALVERAHDVLQLLGMDHEASPKRQSTPDHPIVRLIPPQGAAIDELLLTSGLDRHDLLAELGALEIKGQINRAAGGVYHRS